VTERFEMCGFIGYADRLAGEAFATASVTSVDDLIQVNFERRATRRSLLSSGAESVASLSVASRSSTTKQASDREGLTDRDASFVRSSSNRTLCDGS